MNRVEKSKSPSPQRNTVKAFVDPAPPEPEPGISTLDKRFLADTKNIFSLSTAQPPNCVSGLEQGQASLSCPWLERPPSLNSSVLKNQ